MGLTRNYAWLGGRGGCSLVLHAFSTLPKVVCHLLSAVFRCIVCRHDMFCLYMTFFVKKESKSFVIEVGYVSLYIHFSEIMICLAI